MSFGMMIFINTLQKMLKLDLILQIINYPAGKYWSPGLLEDVPLPRLKDVPKDPV